MGVKKMLSNAIDQAAVARTVGYALGFKDFSEAARNLPQRITIFSVIQQSLQAGFTDYNVRHTVSSVQEVLDLFGICPAYYVMRILKPINGGGIGNIPVDIFPILETTGAKSTGKLTITGTADKTVTHTVVLNGRKFIDSQSAQYVVETGDTATDVATKIIAALNGLLSSSVTASAGGAGEVDMESKWQTLTANEISLTIDIGTDDAGLTYALPTFINGAGAFDLSTALANIGEVWTTGIINTFDETLFDVFENFNGVPDPDTGGTGRWNAKTVKPFIACLGTKVAVKATLLALAAGRESDLTNCLAPAPNSPGFTFEAAANMLGSFMLVMNNRPHSTVADVYYPDMPFPVNNDIGVMKDYNTRDDLVKGGVSTVTFDEALGYRSEDFITFRRLATQAEQAKDWRYCRDIVGIDFNVIYQYRLTEETFLVAKTIVNDTDVVDSGVSTDVIKPKDWKAILFDLFEDLGKKALIADVPFAEASLQVEISSVNAKRFETTFNYKRTSTVRISSTTAFAGFNFG